MVEQSATQALPPFHVALPVTDLETSRAFYGALLGCPEGRSAETWVDFNFFGHQLVCHLSPRTRAVLHSNAVDGDAVPVPHWGVVLAFPTWRELADRLAERELAFILAPRVRFTGQPGEQGTFFVADPSGNVLEFKGLRDRDRLFATD